MVGTAAPRARRLRAGPWELELVDGDLRGVRIDGREAVQRIYLAVRDAEWGTVPARVVRQHMEATADSFRIELEIENRAPGIDVRWRVDVSGSVDGTIAYAIDGVVGTVFSSARIGLCVLLPRTLAGAPYRVHHVDGSEAVGALPLLVAPQQPVQDIGGFTYGLAAGTEASLRFAGETFEMEDQRNWGDASFKIYGTPIARPYPVAVAAGARIRQSVELRPQRRPLVVAVAAPPASPPARLPKIGLALPAEALDADAQARLLALRPDHLRIDVDLRSEAWRDRWKRDCLQVISRMPRPVELAVTTSGQRAPWSDLRDTLIGHGVSVARVLVFDAQREVTPAELVRSARLELMPLGAPIGGGSRGHFCALNRERPASGALEVVAFDLHHQVHAVDDRSILENATAIPDLIASARAIAGRDPIAVSVLSMGPPGVVDPRQHQDIGAAWLIASLTGLATSGAGSVTFDGSILRGGAPGGEGSWSPLLAALDAVIEFSGAEVLSTDDVPNLAILRLRSQKRRRTLIANLVDEPSAMPDIALGAHPQRRAISSTSGSQSVALAAFLPGRSVGIIDGDDVVFD